MNLGPWKRGNGIPKLGFCEAAREFGVTEAYLRGMMGQYNAPKPDAEYAATASSSQKAYYNAAALRKWWRNLERNEK